MEKLDNLHHFKIENVLYVGVEITKQEFSTLKHVFKKMFWVHEIKRTDEYQLNVLNKYNPQTQYDAKMFDIWTSKEMEIFLLLDDVNEFCPKYYMLQAVNRYTPLNNPNNKE
jgi:hypothetical protein